MEQRRKAGGTAGATVPAWVSDGGGALARGITSTSSWGTTGGGREAPEPQGLGRAVQARSVWEEHSCCDLTHRGTHPLPLAAAAHRRAIDSFRHDLIGHYDVTDPSAELRARASALLHAFARAAFA